MKVEKPSSARALIVFDSEFSYGREIVRLHCEATNIFAYPARNITLLKIKKFPLAQTLMIFDSQFTCTFEILRLPLDVNIFAYSARNIIFMKVNKASLAEALMIFDSEFSYGCEIARLLPHVKDLFTYPAGNIAFIQNHAAGEPAPRLVRSTL